MEIVIALVVVAAVAYFIISKNKKEDKKVNTNIIHVESPTPVFTTDESTESQKPVIVENAPDQEPSAYTPPENEQKFGDGAEGNGEVKQEESVKKPKARKTKPTAEAKPKTATDTKPKARKPKITVAK